MTGEEVRWIALPSLRGAQRRGNRSDEGRQCAKGFLRHCEERKRRSNPANALKRPAKACSIKGEVRWIASRALAMMGEEVRWIALPSLRGAQRRGNRNDEKG
jgi:hypothetical protein